MTKRPPTTETHIDLRTILSAGVLAAVLVLVLAGAAAGAATWVVDDDGGAGVDYTTIQAAVDAASIGDEINVFSGTYYEDVNVNKQLILRGVDTGAGMPVVDAGGNGDVITISANGCLLDGFAVTNSGLLEDNAGIEVTSNNNIIRNNTVTNNKLGINLTSSNDNIISDNIVNSNSYPGICLTSSDNNIISNNTADSNAYYGIELYLSSNNTVKDNDANSNTRYGIFVYNSNNNNSMISNTANANVHAGIRFYSSSNNVISGNSLANTKSGISMYGSSDNTIFDNNISFNENGILLDHSSNNIVYHNNLIQNTNQASDNSGPNTWDFGYPLGGNHWSDYADADIKSGPDQDQPGSDGIGDTSYPISGGSSVDQYPLVAPYTPHIDPDISVDLYFEKTPAMGSSASTDKFTAGDEKLGYARTTLTSGDYTVKTYIKMIMPDGSEKYAYSTSSPFCPECPLNFSDTKVPFRSDTWHVETKLWNWGIYNMTGTEPEGNYTWEFWYEDATTGEVLASSNTTYNFSRTTELLQKGRHKYFVRISNIDDDGMVCVNGEEMASATFNGNSGWVEISDKLQYDGENDIRFNVTNHPERYPENWTYKFELSTFTDESKIIWKDSCGSVGSCSCNNNQNTGEVYNKTVKLNITPWFTRETVEYISLDDKTFDLYSIDYNDNPANSDYIVVISPLLAQAFVAEEETGNQEEIQKRIDNKTNQIEEALTAVLDVHLDAYIYFVDMDLGYKSDVEKLRADVYGLPFVHYRGPGGKIIDDNPPHGKTKTYKKIVDAQITTHNFWENDVWNKYKDAVIRKTTDENYKPTYVLILGSAKEFPEYKISNWRVFIHFTTFSDSYYVQKQSDEYIAPIGRLPLQFAYNYSSSPQSFSKKAWIHTADRFGEGLLAIDVVYRLQTPIKNNLIGKGYKNEDIKINESIETYSDDMDVDLTDTSLFVAGWHGSTRKVGAHGGKLNINNIHPLVFASTSCLGSNTGDHENNKLGNPYDLFSSKILSGGASYVGNTRYADGDESIKIVESFIENLVSEKATKTTLGDSWLQTIKNFDGSDYSRDQFRLLGDPALNTSALDDPIENHIPALQPQFNININVSYNETPINGYSLLNMSISDDSSQNITHTLTKDQFATGTGAPKVPIIYINIPMPVNQTIDNVTVVFGDSYTTSINLAEYVSILLTPDGAEVIPGIEIHGDYPPVNFTYSLVTVPDERLLKIQAIPVKYNIDSQIAELYRSINVTIHTKPFVEGNITAKVHIDPSLDYLALHQDENASLIVSLYNDYSATENATDVSVTAEILDNLEIVSANGTINGTIDGNTVTWDVNNLTTSGVNSFKSVELLIQAPASIPDTTIEQINLTATYSNESGGVYEPDRSVPIQVILIPPDYVDLTVSNMVIHRPLKLGTPTNVTAVISNDGDIGITYVSVRLLIDGNESSRLIMDTPAMESQSVNLSIGGLTPGKHQIATIVQPIGFETNITNNVATEDVDIYFAMLPPLSTTDPYNLPYGSTLPIKFTVKDNETSEFIPDYTVNVSILNSTNHILTSFNATSGVQIDSDEARYAVDFNTMNYPELTLGEIYVVSVTFGVDDTLLSYATAHFTLEEDLTPPGGITDLHPTSTPTYLNWTWTNPPDPDFTHTEIYLDDVFRTITPSEHFNATDLTPETSYTISTRTVDNAGNINQTYVNDTATTLPTPGTTIQLTISLDSGWNLISAPLNLNIRKLGNESIVGDPLNVTPEDSLTSIYRYNTTSGSFEKCTHYAGWGWAPATGSESFTELEPGQGYWVVADNDCDLTFTGTAPSDLCAPFDAGWNCIGWYLTSEAELGNESLVGDPLNVTPEDSLTSIYRYNTTSGSFEKCTHYAGWGWAPATGSERFTELEPGRGYWVWADIDCVWNHEA